MNQDSLVKQLLTRISVNPTTGCWEWTGTRNASGRYAAVQTADGQRLAHRVSYEAFKQPTPDGLQIDHLCRVTYCVNPDHLEAVTPAENLRRAGFPAAGTNARQAKPTCPQGHPRNEENTGVNNRGQRFCRVCARARYRAWYSQNSKAVVAR